MSWTASLVSAGADVSAGTDSTLDITLDGHHATYRLHRSLRSPRPAEVSTADVPSLLQVPHVSTRVAAALARSGWSFATTDGAALLRFPDGFTWATEAADRPEKVAAPSQWSRGMSRVVHAVLARAVATPPTQTALAKLAGVTQARVSTIVRDLARAGLITTEHGRPVVTNRHRLVDEWLKRRRFDPMVTYWSTTGDLGSALDTACKRLPGPVIVSGDVAADAEAPHRRPAQLLILTQAGSLTGPGMLPVLSVDEANVVHAVTDDPVVAAGAHDAEWRGRTFLAADPLQVLWDLEAAAGTDATQAAHHWRTRAVRGPR
jgi:hypothetical protein